jgi:hypothetical protein
MIFLPFCSLSKNRKTGGFWRGAGGVRIFPLAKCDIVELR